MPWYSAFLPANEYSLVFIHPLRSLNTACRPKCLVHFQQQIIFKCLLQAKNDWRLSDSRGLKQHLRSLFVCSVVGGVLFWLWFFCLFVLFFHSVSYFILPGRRTHFLSSWKLKSSQHPKCILFLIVFLSINISVSGSRKGDFQCHQWSWHDYKFF